MALLTLYSEVQLLESLVKNAEQIQNFKKLKIVIARKVEIVQDLSNQRMLLEKNSARTAHLMNGTRVMDEVKLMIHLMTMAQTKLLEHQTENYVRLAVLTPFFIIILFLGALLILLASYIRIIRELIDSRMLQDKFEEEKIFAETILNACPDNIVVFDKDLRYISANPTAAKFLLRFTDTYIGKKAQDVFPQSESIADIQSALQGETISRNDFYSPATKSHFELTYTPLKKGEEITGVIAQSRDITTALEANKRLEKQNMELDKMNAELQLFAHISSHDLQEPLRKILMSTSRIHEIDYDVLSDNGKVHFKRIQDAAMSMQTLIEDLAQYSRTNGDQSKFENTDLTIIIQEVISALKDRIDEKQAVIVATECCEAHVIPFQIRQLLHNLIVNALKFSHPGVPPFITITCKLVEGSDLNIEKLSPEIVYCHITVSDNGIGFESVYSEKIFEVFQRLHAKDKYKGTGIGLAIVKKITDNHMGIVTATSVLNEGATFNVYIPTI